MVGSKQPYSAETVAKALTASHGLVSAAAHALGCTPQTVRAHVKRSAVCRDALHDAREATLDLAEAALFKQVAAGEAWAVCFILKTLGRNRGYVERRELTGSDGGPVLTRFVVERVDYADERPHD
jgi:hypothetical protein